MKCVQLTNNEFKPLIYRITNIRAELLVLHGLARYVSKSAWKASGRLRPPFIKA